MRFRTLLSIAFMFFVFLLHTNTVWGQDNESKRNIGYQIRAFELKGKYQAAAQGNNQELISILDQEKKVDLIQCIQKLFGRYTPPWEKIDKESGMNVLGWAIIGGHFDTVKLLVERYHACINTADKNGSFPITHAALVGENRILEYLLNRGADINARVIGKDNHGWPPCFLTLFFGNEETLRILIARGADLSIKDTNGLNVYTLGETYLRAITRSSPINNPSMLMIIFNRGSLHAHSLDQVAKNVREMLRIIEEQKIDINISFPEK
jgi:hypothetical protein